MNTLEALFDLIPVALALVAVFFLSKKFNADRRKHGRFVYFLATITSCLLIVAQLSWWASNALQGHIFGTTFANVIWTVFNSLVMITFIIMSFPRLNDKNRP